MKSETVILWTLGSIAVILLVLFIMVLEEPHHPPPSEGALREMKRQAEKATSRNLDQ